METIKINSTEDTPKVILDADNEIFEISGMSMPEDVNMFYEPVLNWLEEYMKNPNKETEFIFKLTYFNTASSKLILDILYKLEEIFENGYSVRVSWYYAEDDEDMKESGEEYAELVEIPFDLISY
jgi:hypothetical protein